MQSTTKTLPLQLGSCGTSAETPPCSRCSALDETKVAFLAGLSHELITPLNAILGAAQLLRIHMAVDAPTSAKSEDESDLIQIIEDSGQLLYSALGDIMNFSTISQNISLDLRSVDVRDLIESCVEQCSRDILAKDLTVTYTVSELVPVMADPGRMRQVLLNLLKNACKFNRHRGDVHVQVEVSVGVLTMTVRDSGIGMDDAVAERISVRDFVRFGGCLFRGHGYDDGDPVGKHAHLVTLHHHHHQETNFFYQGDNSRTKRFGGIGLGLAITCKLVKAMGGSLDIESNKQQGTMVTVSVPVGHHQHLHGGLNVGTGGTGGKGGICGTGGNGSTAAVVEADNANGSSRGTSLCSDDANIPAGDVSTGAIVLLDIDHAGLASQVRNMLELNGDVVVTRDGGGVELAEVMITSSKQSLRNRTGLVHLPIIYLARPSSRLPTSVIPIDCTQVVLPLTNHGLLRVVGERRVTPLPRISSESKISSRSSLFGSGGIFPSGDSARDGSVRDGSVRDGSVRDGSVRNSIDNSQLPAVMHSSFYKRSPTCREKHQSAADLLSKASGVSGTCGPWDEPLTSRSGSAVLGDSLLLGNAGHSGHSNHPLKNENGGLQILVAEDNDINIKICTKILEHVGGKETIVHVVCDGRQVLSALERNPTYDLVLMDIHMPDMDGIEAAKELRRRGVQCPIVALSADSTVHDECLAAGMRAFLRKPLKVTDVQELLKSLKKGQTG